MVLTQMWYAGISHIECRHKCDIARCSDLISQLFAQFALVDLQAHNYVQYLSRSRFTILSYA